MEKRDIVFGPKADIKRERAKAMRREMTPAETNTWAQLRNNRCGGLHFRRQQIIDGFIADFYCHDAGLIIEVDGSIHHQQVDYDLMRDRILAARGLRIIRFSNNRVFAELAIVLQEIQSAAHDLPSTPPTSSPDQKGIKER